MRRTKTITLNNTGDILLEKSHRAKHLIITVKPFRGVRVAVPRGVSFKEAEDLARKNKNWIITRQRETGLLEQRIRAARLGACPVDKIAAGATITQRLKHLALTHGFSYNKVTIRCQKTRWGSCSIKNNLSLNAKLIRLPEYLMDYVLIHELVHTNHKHHGKRFWKQMDELLGDARALRRELSQYRPELL